MMKGCLIVLAGLFAAVNIYASVAPRVCHTRHPEPAALALRQTVSTFGRSGMPVRASVRAETQTDVVDVLVAFDASACTWLKTNDKGSPIGYARTCVAKMNGCLAHSDLLDHFRFRLAGAVALTTDLSFVGHDLDDVLDLFVNGWGHVTAEGALRKVTDRREAVGADIVTILSARGPHGVVGVGFSLEMQPGGYDFVGDAAQIAKFGDWAYNVCSIQAVDEDYTMLHEIGHNMGAGHPDKSQARECDFELGPQLYGYSAGCYFWRDGVGYYTVMGYNFGGPGPDGSLGGDWRYDPVPCFSSPNVFWNGCRTGTALNDNRRTLLETYRYVAQYRISTLPVGAESVTDEENDKAEQAWNGLAGARPDDGEQLLAGFAVEGAFKPEKAVNGKAPYVGAVYADGAVVGTMQLKIGKPNRKTGVSKIGGTVVLLDGKKYSLANGLVSTGEGPQRAERIMVKSLGQMTLTLGANGFAGTIEGTPMGDLEIRTQALDGRLAVSPACFELDASAAELSEACGMSVLAPCLPEGEKIVSGAGGKWIFRRSGTVSYKSVRDAATGTKAWKLVGLDNPTKPNVSGLKLSASVKTATFKGGFALYADVGTVERPKLKKLKATVTGVIVGGRGYGLATVKGVGSWKAWVR